MSDYHTTNPATGLLVTNGIDSAGNPDGSGPSSFGDHSHQQVTYDHEAFMALPLWVRLAHYAAIASVFAFIFWIMSERGIF